MKKQILLPTAVRREIRETFKVHLVILERALKYERNSKRDKMLRTAALERGGLIYTGVQAPAGYMPDVETRFDHVAGVMHQTFRSRVQLSVNLKENIAAIYVDGQQVVRFDDMTTASWGNVLYSLQQMYNQLNS